MVLSVHRSRSLLEFYKLIILWNMIIILYNFIFTRYWEIIHNIIIYLYKNKKYQVINKRKVNYNNIYYVNYYEYNKERI